MSGRGAYPDLAPGGFAAERVTVADTAVALTGATYMPAAAAAACRAALQLQAINDRELPQARYRYDGGTPTASEGHLLEQGDVLVLSGLVNIARFRAIRTGSVSGVLEVSYGR